MYLLMLDTKGMDLNMKKTKWGLIGCGKVVLKNDKIPFINKNNTITAICTTTMLTAENAKKKIKTSRM